MLRENERGIDHSADFGKDFHDHVIEEKAESHRSVHSSQSCHDRTHAGIEERRQGTNSGPETICHGALLFADRDNQFLSEIIGKRERKGGRGFHPSTEDITWKRRGSDRNLEPVQ